MIAMATAVSAALMPMENKEKKKPSEFARVKYAVEYGKVDVNRVEHQLNGDEHRDEVTSRYKSEKANEEEQSAQSQ